MLCRMYNFDRVFGDRAVREAVSGQRNWFKQEFQESGVVAEDVGEVAWIPRRWWCKSDVATIRG